MTTNAPTPTKTEATAYLADAAAALDAGDFLTARRRARAHLEGAANDEERGEARRFVARFKADPVVAGIVLGAAAIFFASIGLLPH